MEEVHLTSPHPVEHYIHTTHTLIFTISGKTSHWVNSIHQGHNAAVTHRNIHRIIFTTTKEISKDINSSFEDVPISVRVHSDRLFTVEKKENLYSMYLELTASRKKRTVSTPYDFGLIFLRHF